MKLLAAKTEDFTGTEIEGCIVDAMYTAFDQRKEFSTDDILNAISDTIPQAQRDKEELEAVRSWTKSRARLVSGKDRKSNSASDAVLPLKK